MSRKSRRLMMIVASLALATTLATPVSAVTQIADAGVGSPADKLEQAYATVEVPDRFKAETPGVWIVRLDDDPVASYEGGINGLQASSIKVTGDSQLDAEAPEAQEYADYLTAKRSDVLARMSAEFGRSIEPRFTYEIAFNGFSVWLSPDEAVATWKMSGVANVEKNKVHTLDTDNGPAWIGAPAVWDGTAVEGVAGFLGEGVVAGIIDSGINPSNPSFADLGGDGYDHVNPYGEGVYFGACDVANEVQYDETFVCNDKLVGAYDFFPLDDPNTGAYDADGHGSHTASTTAGNFVTATLNAPTLNVDVDISGVAPHASIISYRVCGDDSLGQGSCNGDGIVAAIEQATIDGVDVINYSIGSPSATNPWSEADDLAFLGARDAGVFVAHSAGNEGPDPATSGSPNAPWIGHVAAFTHDRAYPNALINMSGGDTDAPADIPGLGFTAALGQTPIVFAGDYPSDLTDSPELCGVGDLGDFITPWPEGTFEGQIVVCQRGTFGRVEKGFNAAASGAGGYVLVDNGSGLVGDPHEVPGVHIEQAVGEDTLIPWLQSGEGHMAEIQGATRNESPDNADRLAGFSSRGPNPLAEWMMPTYGAPGVDIIAAHGKYDAVEWTFLSGTSMSSPHVAGAGALLSGITGWTPAEMQSALSLTANPDVFDQNGDPATPFDTGSGRIHIVDAANAGFVLGETTANYLAANPAEGGDPADLNMASFFSSQCVQECTFTRTLTSTRDVDVDYTTATDGTGGLTATVTPDAFTLPAGGEITVEVTFDVTSAASDEYHFGTVEFTGADGGPLLHMP
ncbi:MAG: S8 family serine peptidase, partial [Acidimicrobiia bacterium]|nr:S8 family serine peptidase [Acidimicrobiia bacterium]